MSAPKVKFSGTNGLARFLTLTALPVPTALIADAVHHICRDPDSPECMAALERVANEAFPRRASWRARLVSPAKRLQQLAPDLQLQVLRALSPAGTVLHGS